jgi:hypothetical protein
MRNTLLTLTLAFVFTAVAPAQSDKTCYSTQPISPADLTAATTMVRTLVDLQDIQADEEHQALKLHGPEDKLVAADWVLQQLDHPAAAAPSSEYKMTGPHEEVMQIFRISPTASYADLTAITTAIRTVADLQRLFPYQKLNALAARGESGKVALAARVVRQLSPYDGAVPTCRHPATSSRVIFTACVTKPETLDDLPRSTSARISCS